MLALLIAFLVLLIGFIVYSRVVEKLFGPDDRLTPAHAVNDGVDFVPMKKWKIYLIQLLNIAGTGPIFGALMGAVFGPVVFLWVIFGSVLGGAVHDYLSGMISERNNGASLAELCGVYLGNTVRWIVRVFCIVLMVLTGVVFVYSPAELLAMLTPDMLNGYVWCVIILIYYFVATILPIDKFIGKIYPIFGVLLMVMAVAILGGIIFSDQYSIPDFTFENLHPDGKPIWPYMFVTVACGAISGFHATQSPMMSKCINTERGGRGVFYGAMISEAVIALIWAAAGVAYYESTAALNDALGSGASSVVYTISEGLLGKAGAVLAVIGVIVCPITTGDTALRSARLIIAEIFHLDQAKIGKRLIIAVPLLIVVGLITAFAVSSPDGFQTIWRYFSWSNQTLAAITLWVTTAYLIEKCKYRFGSLITALPAVFMTDVCVTYILTAPEGLRLDYTVSVWIGFSVAAVFFILYLVSHYIHVTRKKDGIA